MNVVATNIIRLLLVEDNPGDAELIQEALRASHRLEFVVTHAEQLHQAVGWTQTHHFDLVVLDLSLPDSSGLYTVINARERIPDLPIVVLTGLNDEMLGLEAVQAGAQDYLVKGQLTDEHLTRTLHYALTRHATQESLKTASMTDELTGLNNRRGFLALAEQQRKLAQRTGSAFLMLYMDIDQFKGINDTLGHYAGDRALVDVAQILRATFRDSDVIARLGGDEFVVAVLEADEDCADVLTGRLQRSLDLYNARENCAYTLRMSIGVAHHGFGDAASIEDMLAKADSAMYVQKRGHKKEGLQGVA